MAWRRPHRVPIGRSFSPAFRIVMDDPFNETHWHTPSLGDVLPVKCDPRRQKAKFDTSAMQAQQKARKDEADREQAAQFDAAVNKPPGSL